MDVSGLLGHVFCAVVNRVLLPFIDRAGGVLARLVDGVKVDVELGLAPGMQKAFVDGFIAFPRRVFPLRKAALQSGSWIGVFLAAGYLTQIVGLATITASPLPVDPQAPTSLST